MVVTPVPLVLRNVPELASDVGLPLSKIVVPSPSRSNVAVGALLKLVPVLKATCPPVQVPVFSLTSVPPAKVLSAAPLIVRPPLALTKKVDAVLPSVPAVQLNGPASAKIPEPARKPPFKL